MALVCAGPGVDEALAARGVRTVRDGKADVVVVGFHRDFDYGRLQAASTAVRAGARLLATNDDATYPTPDGLIPGGGAILAAVSTASGVQAEVAGKPYRPWPTSCGPGSVPDGVMVGDRADTDGRFAARARLPLRPRSQWRDHRARPSSPSPTSSPPTWPPSSIRS